jgi:hypothetical protein
MSYVTGNWSFAPFLIVAIAVAVQHETGPALGQGPARPGVLLGGTDALAVFQLDCLDRFGTRVGLAAFK